MPTHSIAGNGLYLTGYGNESVLMGGADVAVARDAFATNNNPAGMTQLSKQAADLELVLVYLKDGKHTDAFGNYRKQVKNSVIPIGNGAYARRFENSPFAAGVALVVQGGLGWVYSGFNTAFGTRDDAGSLFTIIKLAPAVAWKVSDQLSLGAALGINYISGAQELFPNTSDAASGFSGFHLKETSGSGLSYKLGLQYHPLQDVTVGVTYAPQSSISLKNGNLQINFTNTIPGLGVVRYDNATLTGLRLPEELALGLAFRPTSLLLVSLQDKWYNWSEAINNLKISASNSRTAGAPATVAIPSVLGLVDQHVISIGLAYDYDADTVLLAGINHGSRPIPDQNLNPLFSVIPARHYTLGARRKLNAEWSLTGGVLIAPVQSVTYDSPLFGPRANERNYGVIFHTMLSRRW